MILFAMNAMAANIKWRAQSVDEILSQLDTPVFANATEQTNGVDIDGSIDGLLYTGYLAEAKVMSQTGVLLATLGDYSTDLYPEINTMKIRSSKGYLVMRVEPDSTELWIDLTEAMSPYDPGTDWDLSGMSASDFFVMELGYIDYDMGDYDDPTTWDTFHLMAYSDLFTLQELYDACHISPRSALAPPPYVTPWTPDTLYAVPEPSTALLALLGVGIFLKRRK